MKKNASMSSRALKRKMGINPKEIFSAMHGILQEVDPEMAKKIKKDTKIDQSVNVKDVLKKLKDTVLELENELMEEKPEKKMQTNVTFTSYSEKKTNTR